ncbi:MAG: thiamine phosphate synthase [Firmicutes bacterium]|nr:thiamine phosphate synthase [Bacillota bacterium]
MIISMFNVAERNFKIICVTNRQLCRGDFLVRLHKIAAARPDAVMLREKDLPVPDYLALAGRVQQICRTYGVSCIWHTYFNEETEFLHLPLEFWQQYNLPPLRALGVSCHSLAEAVRTAGSCNYLTAGHIFATDCKQGLPGRGLDWLRLICNAVDVPVYAIGGITAANIKQVKAAGAGGVCLMSGFMTCAEPAVLFNKIKKSAGFV